MRLVMTMATTSFLLITAMTTVKMAIKIKTFTVSGIQHLAYQKFLIVDEKDDFIYYKGNSALLGFSFGRSRSFGERVVVDMSLGFSLSFGIGKTDTVPEDVIIELANRYGYPDNYYEDDYDYVSEYEVETFNYEARARMARLNTLALRVGISGLLF